MILVHVNGIAQLPGIDYHTTQNSISFSSPPQAGSTISIQSKSGVLANILADGSTYLYQFMSDFENSTSQMLEDAFHMCHVPAVADMLERLRVVVELAKQDG
jgi:hypothetical protein